MGDVPRCPLCRREPHVGDWDACPGTTLPRPEEPGDEAALARVVADPGKVVPRGDNYTETLPRWIARAVLASDWLAKREQGAAVKALRDVDEALRIMDVPGQVWNAYYRGARDARNIIAEHRARIEASDA